METQYPRLDRIEKEMEAFFKGMSELRIAQLKTDEQISELRAAQLKTDEQLKITEKVLRNTTKQLAEIGLVQGEVADFVPKAFD